MLPSSFRLKAILYLLLSGAGDKKGKVMVVEEALFQMSKDAM
jgi:hypothetical protein